MDMQSFDMVRQLSASHYLVRSLHVIAELGVADEIGETPTVISDLAKNVNAHPDALQRVLRVLSSRGIFSIKGDQVSHTAASQFLQSGHPASLRDFVRMFAQPIQWQSAGELMHCVRTGEAAAARVSPGGLWGYFAGHPEEARMFDAAMEAKSSAQIADLLRAHDFSRYRRIVV